MGYRRHPFQLVDSISIRTDCGYCCSEVHGDVVRDVTKKSIARHNKYLIHIIADGRYNLQHINLYISLLNTRLGKNRRKEKKIITTNSMRPFLQLNSFSCYLDFISCTIDK